MRPIKPATYVCPCQTLATSASGQGKLTILYWDKCCWGFSFQGGVSSCADDMIFSTKAPKQLVNVNGTVVQQTFILPMYALQNS